MNVLQTIVGGAVLIALVAAGIFAIGLLRLYRARATAPAPPPTPLTDLENHHHEGDLP